MLLAVSLAGLARFFDFGRAFVARPDQFNTFLMLLVPMISCGMALLVEKTADEGGEE